MFDFTVFGDPTEMGVATVLADGTGRVDLTQMVSEGPGEFTAYETNGWSPDGTRVLIIELNADDQVISVAAADGSDPIVLAPAPGDEEPYAADWGPASGRPVIFIPGILGSEIWCDPVTRDGLLWPALGVDEDKLKPASDGATNASPACPGAGPTEPEYTEPGHVLEPGNSGIAETLFGHEIYGSAVRQLAAAVGPRNLYAFPWDWRRDTEASILRLDETINAALTETGAEKVQIVAHSYGGLLALQYAEDPDRRINLARVTTVGAPYMGSPKSTFPLLVGTELPFESGLEFPFGGQDDLRSFATTLRGLYNLWPSPAFGKLPDRRGPPAGAADPAGTASLIGDSGGFAGLSAGRAGATRAPLRRDGRRGPAVAADRLRRRTDDPAHPPRPGGRRATCTPASRSLPATGPCRCAHRHCCPRRVRRSRATTPTSSSARSAPPGTPRRCTTPRSWI